MNFIVDSVDKTVDIGLQIGKLVNRGDIICLIGDLGTGKTHITKGIAKGLEIHDHITSPTFNIVNEYKGRLKLYHFEDRKSTRLNSSHANISYAVFCLKKKKISMLSSYTDITHT